MRSAVPADQLPANFNLLPIAERLPMWASACCANPSPTSDTDHNGKPIIKCANCGART
jgi:hypothetical protein